jgi:hypothetical protein
VLQTERIAHLSYGRRLLRCGILFQAMSLVGQIRPWRHVRVESVLLPTSDINWRGRHGRKVLGSDIRAIVTAPSSFTASSSPPSRRRKEISARPAPAWRALHSPSCAMRKRHSATSCGSASGMSRVFTSSRTGHCEKRSHSAFNASIKPRPSRMEGWRRKGVHVVAQRRLRVGPEPRSL